MQAAWEALAARGVARGLRGRAAGGGERRRGRRDRRGRRRRRVHGPRGRHQRQARVAIDGPCGGNWLRSGGPRCRRAPQVVRRSACGRRRRERGRTSRGCRPRLGRAGGGGGGGGGGGRGGGVGQAFAPCVVGGRTQAPLQQLRAGRERSVSSESGDGALAGRRWQRGGSEHQAIVVAVLPYGLAVRWQHGLVRAEHLCRCGAHGSNSSPPSGGFAKPQVAGRAWAVHATRGVLEFANL